jgi:signal transduction histidine kinase
MKTLYRTNRYYALTLAIIIVVIISYLDWYTGYEIQLTIFYIIPLTLLAINKKISLLILIIFVILLSATRIIADILSLHVFANPIVLYWNGIARLVIFMLVTILIYYLSVKQEEIMMKNEKLKLLNEEKNRYLGIAAHDLRNPIGAVYSFSELLLEEKELKIKMPEQYEIAEYINYASKNSLDLINNLLDISKIDSGIVNLQVKTQNYIDFIKARIYIIQHLAKKKNIRIILKSELNLLNASFDSIYFQEVTDNLLSNAIKYSHSNSEIIVKITTNGIIVKTEIIDKGVGIPENETENIFQAFKKASSKPTKGESGTGLGLYIVKKIISLHNGNIGVVSKFNEGSNFYYELPLK